MSRIILHLIVEKAYKKKFPEMFVCRRTLREWEAACKFILASKESEKGGQTAPKGLGAGVVAA